MERQYWGLANGARATRWIHWKVPKTMTGFYIMQITKLQKMWHYEHLLARNGAKYS